MATFTSTCGVAVFPAMTHGSRCVLSLAHTDRPPYAPWQLGGPHDVAGLRAMTNRSSSADHLWCD